MVRSPTVNSGTHVAPPVVRGQFDRWILVYRPKVRTPRFFRPVWFVHDGLSVLCDYLLLMRRRRLTRMSRAEVKGNDQSEWHG